MIKNISFTLNGKKREIKVDASLKLLEVLRDHLGLKGTKCGCGEGECGACTVVLNGQSINSCLVPIGKAQDAVIWTVDGLQKGNELHPIQEAFIEMGAIQCGFCTPGMIMSTKALLDNNLSPTRDDIEKALGGNICRCTGFLKIIEAVEYAAAKMRGENPSRDAYRTLEKSSIVAGEQRKDVETPEGRVLGKRHYDVDGVAKVTGALKFAADYESEGMLYGAFVWAPIACGKLNGLDTSEAEKQPGVVRILTYKDVPGENAFGCFEREQPVFCSDKINFYGDMLALVVAEDEQTARRAAKLVKVDAEETEGIYTMEDGIAKDMVMASVDHEMGDVKTGREKAYLHLSADFDMEPVEHGYIETEAALGLWHGDKGVQVIACTQSPFEIHQMLTKVLDLPEDKIQVTASPLGGAFGGKCDTYIESAAGVAAMALKRPVMISLNREESMKLTTKRHAFKNHYELGLSEDGKILYLDTDIVSDAGSYMILSPGVLQQACIFSGGPYEIPNIKVHGRTIRTNNAQGGAFRGFGINQSAICIETLLDEAAEKLNIDPFELRRRNALKVGSKTVTGEILKQSVGIIDTINECQKIVERDRPRFEAMYPEGKNGRKVLGVGMASGFKNVGVGKGLADDGGCILTILPDGKIEMRISGVDMGQGFRTAMMQIAAEKLGRDPEDFVIVSGDTKETLHHNQIVSERATLCTGKAVYIACEMLLEKMEKENWKIGDICTVSYQHILEKSNGIDDVEARMRDPEGYFNYPAYAYLTQAVFIELDKETGKVKVLKCISANDLGRAINPQIIESQLEGSCSMGTGYALTERYPSKEGLPLVKSFGQLGLPTIEQTPEYEFVLIEDPDPKGPYGAKGISEVATVPMTPAVLNAIYDAVGIRMREVPAIPEKIIAALEKNQSLE